MRPAFLISSARASRWDLVRDNSAMRYLFLVSSSVVQIPVTSMWNSVVYLKFVHCGQSSTDYICAPLNNFTSVPLGGSDTTRVLEVSARRSDW